MFARSLKSKPAAPFSKWYRKSPVLTAPMPQPPAMRHSILIIISPMSSRHSHSIINAAKETLGFSLLGLSQFGPWCFLSWTTCRSDSPTHLSTKPRFCLNSHLCFLCKRLCRSKEPVVRGHRLEPNQTSLHCWYKPSLRTWPLKSLKGITYGFNYLYRGQMKGLRKNGIMIPSPRSGDYRSFLNLLPPYPLFIEFIHVQSINFNDNFLMLKTLKLRSGYFLFVLNRRQTLCGILNLHGRGFHAREDPPVLLRFYTHYLRTLVYASSKVLRYVFISLKVFGLMLLNPSCERFDGGFGSLSNDHSPSNSSDDFKPYTLHTTSNCYVLPKLNSHYTAALANNFKHQSTFTFARTLVKALLRVAFLVPARITSLTPSSTPLRLLTMANRSSIDLLLEESSILFDLTCTNKLPSFWLKALKELLSINLTYLYIYLMLSLGYTLYCGALNFGNSVSLYLCTWFIH
ncbi:hypothetical protein ISN45_Aa05g021480 [Arabidopsis thaliana x Arabidopsis arenosa]|uniref:Uncharacterized protein n=1 Tax=Arabidopsis thaliana x Arabidopsis arenosa TaxID=1240361 RepID=A0A8T1ZNK5_9BRAS|nr:hypothetical protein ISN45_Aa05g021480 [Arabidopsis thaliana x Arabidopsis arenosa]